MSDFWNFIFGSKDGDLKNDPILITYSLSFVRLYI